MYTRDHLSTYHRDVPWSTLSRIVHPGTTDADTERAHHAMHCSGEYEPDHSHRWSTDD